MDAFRARKATSCASGVPCAAPGAPPRHPPAALGALACGELHATTQLLETRLSTQTAEPRRDIQ